jgi:hypothetical protein
MLWGVLAAFAAVTDMLLLSQRQPKRCLITDILALVGTGVLLLGLVPFGAKIYLIGLAGLYLIIVSISLFWLVQVGAANATGISSAILPPIVSCLTAYFICEGGREFFAVESDSFVSAAIYGSWFFIFYVACLRLFFPGLLANLVTYLPAQRYVGRLFLLRTHA